MSRPTCGQSSARSRVWRRGSRALGAGACFRPTAVGPLGLRVLNPTTRTTTTTKSRPPRRRHRSPLHRRLPHRRDDVNQNRRIRTPIGSVAVAAVDGIEVVSPSPASSSIDKAANRSEGRSNPEAGSRRWWLLLLRSERVKRPCSDRSSPSREMTNWMVESLPAVDWIPSRGRGRVDSSSQSSTAIGSVVLAELPDEERPSRRRDARWGRW